MPDWDGRHLVRDRRTAGSAPSTRRRRGRGRSTSARRSPTRSRSTSGGVYVVTVEALYGSRSTPPAGPRSTGARRTTAAREQKPGQLSQGSGTTPTLLPGGLVAITDNADPRMNVQFYDATTGAAGLQGAGLRAPAPAPPRTPWSRSGTGVIVENNYGYDSPLSTLSAGRPAPASRASTSPATGVQGRLDLRRDRADVGRQGVAGHRPGLRLHEAADLVGRQRLVPHRHRRPHRPHRVLACAPAPAR